MTWEIALGIFAMIGFIISIGKIISNNTRAMTEVKCGIDELRSAFSDQKSDMCKVHDQLEDHEKRIVIIEHK